MGRFAIHDWADHDLTSAAKDADKEESKSTCEFYSNSATVRWEDFE